MENNKHGNLNKQSRHITAAAVIIACAAGFAVLLYIVVKNGSVSWDEPVQAFFFSLRQPGLNTLCEAVTYLGNWYTVTVLCLILLIYPSTRRSYGVPACVAAILTQIIKTVIKYSVCRPRPDAAVRLIEESGWSFPSGHAITSMAVLGVIFLALLASIKAQKDGAGASSKSASGLSPGKKKALLVCCAVFSFAIGLTRIYLGVHYPSDVAAGWLAGIAVIAIVCILRPQLDRLGGKLDDLAGRITGQTD